MSNPITTASNPRVGEDVGRSAYAVDAVADAWASIDGKLDKYRAGRLASSVLDEPGGHFSGYQAEAQELISRLRSRGYDVVASAPSPEAEAGGDLASAIAAEIMGHGWALPDFLGDEDEADEECDRRHGQVQRAVEAVLARSGKLVASTGSEDETKGASASQTGLLPDGPTASRSSGFAAAIPSRGWQPIATAPKDGTDVLLYAAAWDWTWGIQMGRFEQGQWFTGEGSVDENEAGFDPDAPIGEDVDLDELTNFGPTHWMPIPEPPASCDRSPKGEDAEGGFVHEGAVAEGQTPEATPKSSLDQTPVDPQMTVEEARQLLDGIRDPKALADYYRNMARLEGIPRQAAVWSQHAANIEAALSLIAEAPR